MGTDHDALYRQVPDALGPRTPALGLLLRRFDRAKLSILDVGRGRGRDALPIARAGHRVHGIDLSAAGIAQRPETAEAKGLQINATIADLPGVAANRPL